MNVIAALAVDLTIVPFILMQSWNIAMPKVVDGIPVLDFSTALFLRIMVHAMFYGMFSHVFCISARMDALHKELSSINEKTANHSENLLIVPTGYVL